MSTLELENVAAAVCYIAHLGQIDKSGVPYYLHPYRVANYLDEKDHEGRTVAYLHDVLEDTKLTVSDLVSLMFPPEIIASVVTLTRVNNEPSDAYYARVRQNAVAKRVKKADIKDNTDPKRLALLPKETSDRLIKKYSHAIYELDKE